MKCTVGKVDEEEQTALNSISSSSNSSSVNSQDEDMNRMRGSNGNCFLIIQYKNSLISAVFGITAFGL